MAKNNSGQQVSDKKKNPFYKAAKTKAFLAYKDGKINSVKMDLFSNAGAYTDLSPSILERSLFHADSAYYYPNAEIKFICVNHFIDLFTPIK